MSNPLPHAPYSGFYINLDRSTDRNTWIKAQLNQYQLAERYTRFPAVDGTRVDSQSTLQPQEVGCFLSHYGILQQNLAQQTHLHIVEDDVLFCRRTANVLQAVIVKAFNHFDIIFTDLLIPLQIDPIRFFKSLFDRIVGIHGPVAAASFEGFTVIELKDKWFAGASSYLVNKDSLSRLHELYRAELERGPRMPLDLFLASCAYDGLIRAGCVFPFVTSVRLEETIDTTMPLRHCDNRSVLATNIARHTFFVDCDWQKCRALASQIWQPNKLGPHEELIANLVNYKLFGDFKSF